MCNCKSYNQPEEDQIDESVVLPLDDGTVCIDKCISKVIKHLWKNDIYTISSCCGHNKRKPSLVFTENLSGIEAYRIKRIIKEIDDRDFDIMSWILTNLS